MRPLGKVSTARPRELLSSLRADRHESYLTFTRFLLQPRCRFKKHSTRCHGLKCHGQPLGSRMCVYGTRLSVHFADQDGIADLEMFDG
jgi:hypothetical protein